MPTYEYICESCGHELERFQSITARPLRKCPKCGKNKLQRLIGTGAGIIFKGSGFYQTDYRSESYKEGEKSEKKSTEKKADKKEKKSEGKEAKPSEKTKSGTKGKKKSV